MIEQALISGQIGVALYEENGQCFVLSLDNPGERLECRPADRATLFGPGVEFSTLARTDLSEIESRLEIGRRCHRALQLVISGLDEELDDESRSLSIEAAEELLQDNRVFAFVRLRMLSRPLPEIADTATARRLASSLRAAQVAAIYAEALESREAARALWQTWQEVALEFFATGEEQAHAERALIESGGIAGMSQALAYGNAQSLSLATVKYGRDPELQREVPQTTHILNALRVRLLEQHSSMFRQGHVERRKPVLKDQDFPAASSVKLKTAERIKELLAGFKRGKREDKRRRMRGAEAKAKVDNQIEAIDKLIRQGNLNRAGSYLNDLIKFQVQHSERGQLGMSLCALAAKAINANALDLAEKMVDYALMLGVEDAVIWNTRAEALKARGWLDKALAAYEETMARFPENAVARAGRAEVLKEMGRFEAALAAYEETMARFSEDVVVRAGRAEVLKEMGRFEAALAAYEETMARFPENAVARNGRAEVLKAIGRFPEALAAYEETLARFPENAVARNGRASVLMLLGRFEQVSALLQIERPISREDWIGYHIAAMSFLKRGDFDVAIRRLEYGLRNVPWASSKDYYVTAIGVAKIWRGEFAEAEQLLRQNVVRLDVFQRQKRMAFIGHAQAEQGKSAEALASLSELRDTPNPRIANLRDNLPRFYNLGQRDALPLAADEADRLDRKIKDDEWYLAQAA